MGGTLFDNGTILLKGTVCIHIVYEEIFESGYPQGVGWTLWIEYAYMDYLDMINIAIVSKHHAYIANRICLGGQYLSCFQCNFGWSEFSS